jgi:hypothetical protein
MAIVLVMLVLQGWHLARSIEPDSMKTKPNRLAKEASPYLLQHAYNPVEWYPWGEEAFARAKKEDKLIFLSIGYSSCHWCHVMERESFANEAIAKLMNDNFVCIKVDREERPDIDDIYMTALQVTGVSGGWPLTMFLTPEGKPIFGGTYFPPEDKKLEQGTIPGMKSMLAKVVELHKDKKKDLFLQADAVAEQTQIELNRLAKLSIVTKLEPTIVVEAMSSYELDPKYGGLGRAASGFRGTKFPRVSALLFLQAMATEGEHAATKKLLDLTLEQMAIGGLYDHLAGGFHRYSTEPTWTVPHFEKMLYDQAQLVELYANAYAADPRPSYKRVITGTLEFVLRDMATPSGCWASALDADSDGEEGAYYVWTAKELAEHLGNTEDAKLFRQFYLPEKANFEGDRTILRLPKSFAQLAAEHGHDEQQAEALLQPICEKLLSARCLRTKPFLDTKIITSWNGQMIAAMARAGAVLDEPKYIAHAEAAAKFLLGTMRQDNGRFHHLYAAVPNEKPMPRGYDYLEDYTHVIHGLLELHRATKKPEWLASAEELQALQEKHFGDADRGGYFNTANDHEKLFARGKDSYDGAQPSCNGMALRNLVALWRLTSKADYKTRAEKGFQAMALSLKTQPNSVPLGLLAYRQFASDTGLSLVPDLMPKSPAKEPKHSADVVAIKLEHAEDGQFTLTITVEQGWHIYANTVGQELLAEAATQCEVSIDGKAVSDVQLTYPKGTQHKDDVVGDYYEYSGSVVIKGQLPKGQRTPEALKALTVKAKVTACSNRKCLLPSTLTVPAKP